MAITTFTRIQRLAISPKSLPTPRFLYSPVIQSGPWTFISGLVGLVPATGKLTQGGAFGQSEQILRNLCDVAEELALPLDHLLIARIFCTDFDAFGEVNRAWENCFIDVVPPARTSVGVTALPLGALVEMEFQFLNPWQAVN